MSNKRQTPTAPPIMDTVPVAEELDPELELRKEALELKRREIEVKEQKLRYEKERNDRKDREDVALLKITNRIDQELQNGNATITMNASIIPSGDFSKIEHRLRERYCGSHNLYIKHNDDAGWISSHTFEVRVEKVERSKNAGDRHYASDPRYK